MAVKARKASYSFRTKKAEAGKKEHTSLQPYNIEDSFTFSQLVFWLAQLFQIRTPKMQQKPDLASEGSSKHQPHQFSVLITLKMPLKKDTSACAITPGREAAAQTHWSVINNTGRGCLPPRSRCIVEFCGVLVERRHDSCHQSHLLSGHTRDWSWFQNTHTGWTGSPPGVCVCVCNSSGDPSRVFPCPHPTTAGPVL